jgi:uncharacterized protein involved in cysteine biosynthesis
VITKRGIVIALTALLALDALVFAWMVWLLSQGPESDPSGVWDDWVRLLAFLSFPIIAIALAVMLEVEGWRALRRRRQRQRPHVR